MSGTAIAVDRVKAPKPIPEDLTQVPFSASKSDHMLVAEYADGVWREPTIRPYGPLPLSPSISALQYGISVFEGLKAHRLPDGGVGLFRVRDNARRMQRSAERLAMPAVPEALFCEGVRELVRLDEAWVPPHGNGALYIRPCLFSIDESVRVKPADRYLFVVFTFPYGTYYAAPVDVLVTERFVRAFPGGVGDVKPCGNYAPTLVAERDAQAAGYHTVLWLDGLQRRFVEECGVMNVFFVVDDEVITPALDGTILPGVTRDSAIVLLREMGVPVHERRVAIEDVVSAAGNGGLTECFGTGTAATLSHVRAIRWRDRNLELPPLEARRIGPVLRQRLVAIATGLAPDRHGWLESVKVTSSRERTNL